MNLILLNPDDFTAPDRVVLAHRRAEHIINIHRAKAGQELKVGLINDQLGTGKVVSIDTETVTLDVQLEGPPPPPLPLTLVLSLPRPQSLKKVLESTVSMGLKRLILIHSNRVEKSYWHSPLLEEQNLQKHIVLGLEQGVDTIPPVIEFKKRFRPFVEDELPALTAGKTAIVAHPGVAAPCPHEVEGEIILAIGPEGGFNDFEVQKLQEAGLQAVHLGSHILRVEYAIPYIFGRLV